MVKLKMFFGYLLLAVSVLIAISIFGRIPVFMQDFIGLIKTLQGKLDTYESSKAIAKFVFWILLAFLSKESWSRGKKLIKPLS